MSGMDWTTGRLIDDRTQLVQSIRVILSTPRLTRIVRRSFGADIFYLIDQPETQSVDYYRAVASALANLDNFTLDRVAVKRPAPGQIEIEVSGIYTPSGEPLRVGVSV